MKAHNIIKIIGFFILMLSTIGCNNLKPNCNKVIKKEMILLMDVSDESLFTEIKNDVSENFSMFMKDAPFGKINDCETFKMSIGNLSGLDELNIKSAKIGIVKKGMSGKDKQKYSNPTPLIRLLKNSLSDYSAMSTDIKYNNSTNILQTTIKAIVGMGDDSENTLLIFSDMIINNKTEKVNFYREIPKDVGGIIRKLIDPVLLNKFKEKIASGMELKVIVVHKNEPKNKVNKKKVKAFWVKCFKDLEIGNVQFKDNLTNNILWD